MIMRRYSYGQAVPPRQAEQAPRTGPPFGAGAGFLYRAAAGCMVLLQPWVFSRAVTKLR